MSKARTFGVLEGVNELPNCSRGRIPLLVRRGGRDIKKTTRSHLLWSGRGGRSQSKLLSEEYQSKLDAEGQTIIGIIRDSAVRMGNLIEGLLAFSRLGRQVMGSAEINVAELVRGAFSEAGSGETTFRTVNFKVADIPPVIGDPALMRQVFVNLLSNA